MNVEEPELLKRLTNPATQQEAFAVLVNRYTEPLYRQVRRMVLTHDDANDVLQNTFMKAWQGLEHFEGRSKLSTWLYRIAVNESLTFLRSREQEKNHSGSSDDPTIAQQLLADEYFDGDEIAAQLQEAIQTLPPVQRHVFQLHYFEEMKFSEISDILGTTEGALKASYHLATKKISDFFKNID